MAKFRVVIRVVDTVEHEYLVSAETNAEARSRAMTVHISNVAPCIGSSRVTDIVSTKVVKAE